MKTTVEISDILFERAREAAKARGTTLRALIEQGLHKALEQPSANDSRPVMRDFSFGKSNTLRDLDIGTMRSERDFILVDGELVKR